MYKAVKRSSVNPHKIGGGDYIIVTGAESDIAGIVEKIDINIDNSADIILKTSSGTRKTLQISDKNYIHIIQRANMLNMRNHTDYERDLKNVDKTTHEYTKKDQHPALSLDEKSDKSELPASKISLVMKSSKNGNNN